MASPGPAVGPSAAVLYASPAKKGSRTRRRFSGVDAGGLENVLHRLPELLHPASGRVEVAIARSGLLHLPLVRRPLEFPRHVVGVCGQTREPARCAVVCRSCSTLRAGGAAPQVEADPRGQHREEGVRSLPDMNMACAPRSIVPSSRKLPTSPEPTTYPRTPPKRPSLAEQDQGCDPHPSGRAQEQHRHPRQVFPWHAEEERRAKSARPSGPAGEPS